MKKTKKQTTEAQMKKTAEGISSNTDCDQDNDISFMNDTDDEIHADEIEEDWIEDMKRSTAIAVERMKGAYPMLD